MTDEKLGALRKVSYKGRELTVTLGTNKSTGYQWGYLIYGASVKPSANRAFQAADSYSYTNDKGTCTYKADISPTDITVSIQDGQIELCCEASAVSGGAWAQGLSPGQGAAWGNVRDTLRRERK